MDIQRIAEVVDGLNKLEKEELIGNGYVNSCFLHPDTGDITEDYKWHFIPGKKKFSKLNHGHSGTFMIENATGEIYNIKGYGVADYNKKKKADLGNINTVDIKRLFLGEYNYLR